MAPGERKRFRHKFYIFPEIQRRFVLFYVVGCAIVSVLMVVVIFGFVWMRLSQFISISSGVNPHEVFVDILTRAMVAAGVLFVVTAVGGSLLMIFVSHRVAGPVYRLEKMLATTVAADTEQLRSDDALQTIYAKVCTLQMHNAELVQKQEKIEAVVEELAGKVSQGKLTSEGASGMLAKLQKLASETPESDLTENGS